MQLKLLIQVILVSPVFTLAIPPATRTSCYIFKSLRSLNLYLTNTVSSSVVVRDNLVTRNIDADEASAYEATNAGAWKRGEAATDAAEASAYESTTAGAWAKRDTTTTDADEASAYDSTADGAWAKRETTTTDADEASAYEAAAW